MSHATSAPPGATPPPRRAEPAYRVIYHAQVCPECGSDDITESEVETGDGITEIALTCTRCGTAWPVACVVDWTTTS
jgi:ribosomal protein S27AE